MANSTETFLVEKSLDLIDRTLYDGLFSFYGKTFFYEYNAMHLELSDLFLDKITDHEKDSGTIVDKEPLYFYNAILQITFGNTIGPMANWELAVKEQARTSGSI